MHSWTVCPTFDLHAVSVWLSGFSPATPAMLSRGEYGARVGVPRILRLLSTFDIHAAFFVPAHTAESFPRAVDFSLDDWPHFTFNYSPLRVGFSAPQVLEIWTEEFDYMVEHEPNGILTLTMHPQVIGRGHRIKMLERFIEHVRAQAGARFGRMGDVALELAAGQVI